MASPVAYLSVEDLQKRMANEHFGYGSWEAPFWFLGPEQGMSGDDKESSKRIRVWAERGCPDLDDCFEFHQAIEEFRWHGKQGSTAALEGQKTWQKLLSLVLGYHGKPTSRSHRLEYQAKKLGLPKGETCVIELSGIAAPNQNAKRDFDENLLCKRIETIKDHLDSSSHKVFVVYGKGRKGSCNLAWERLSAGTEQVGLNFAGMPIVNRRGTIMVRMPHPTASVLGNSIEGWEKLGETIKKLRESQAST